MIRDPRIRPLAIGMGAAVLLGGCFFPFPPFVPGDPGSGLTDARITVINDTGNDLVITFVGDYPITYAVGAGERATADLYAGRSTEVRLADAECLELDTLTLDPEAEVPEAIRIADDSLSVAEAPADIEPLPALLEFFECGLIGVTVTAGERVTAATGTLLLEGEDGSTWALEPATATLAPVSGAATGSATYDAEFAWSPDGTRLAFSRYDESGQAIHVLDPDAAEPRQLLDGGAMPAWSPDGARIAFVTYTVLSPEDFAAEELRVVDVGTREVSVLAPASRLAGEPSWSPDGKLIAFTGGLSETGEVHLVDAGGGEPRVIEADAGQSLTEPVWSPDGVRLAATLNATGLFSRRSGIALIDADSGTMSVATEDEDGFVRSPTWSPDGQHLAFLRAGMSFSSDLVVMEIGTGTEVVAASGVLTIAGWR